MKSTNPIEESHKLKADNEYILRKYKEVKQENKDLRKENAELKKNLECMKTKTLLLQCCQFIPSLL